MYGPIGAQRDRRRDSWLGEQGYRVVRIWNGEVMSNLEGVCETILAAATGTMET